MFANGVVIARALPCRGGVDSSTLAFDATSIGDKAHCIHRDQGSCARGEPEFLTSSRPSMPHSRSNTSRPRSLSNKLDASAIPEESARIIGALEFIRCSRRKASASGPFDFLAQARLLTPMYRIGWKVRGPQQPVTGGGEDQEPPHNGRPSQGICVQSW